MIFLTVGSELPFDRLVRAVDSWCSARNRNDVFGQIADRRPQGYCPKNFTWCEFLEPEDFQHKIKESEFIIAHAGMGSIIAALTYSKPIVIMPRLVSFKETRNDHQVATVERLGIRSGIHAASDEDRVSVVLDELTNNKIHNTADTISPFAEDRLLKVIGDFIRNE